MALKKHDLSELEQIYSESESVDSEVFTEMRSNLLLIAGDHYNKRKSSYFSQIRDTKALNDQQKLRLTKNHVQKIVKTYVNNIVSMAPGVGFKPANPQELQDQKSTEIHHSIYLAAKKRYHWDELVDDWADDLIGIGEVATKIFYDHNAGEIVDYTQDEAGDPVPVFKGGFVFEKVFGFNLLRDAGAKGKDESQYFIIRKMVKKDELVSKFPDHKSKLNASSDETMVVFDGSKSGYRTASGECLVKEYYFKPCSKYPKGYYFIATKDVILNEGELPGGIFPIVFETCDKIQTSMRGRSIVKQMRPYQAEINRSASKIAEHQITLGDDKLLIQNGSKTTAGAQLPGVRTINYTGVIPTILPGRDGSQYLAYMQAQIEELYMVMGVQEDSMEEQNGQLDPYALLFRAASQKKKFKRYIRRFERFLIEVTKTYLSLAKIFLPEDEIVMMVGRNEQVNISEFKNANDIGYEITIEAQSDDVETKLGQQLAINNLLQYTGTQFSKEDIGKFVKAMPYANLDECFTDLTLDYDAATNDILALDRGEQPPVHEYDTHVYMIKRLVSRMRQADFKFLPEQVQMNYMLKTQAHEMAQAQQIQKLKQAESELIPTGGYMVACDLYVPKGSDPTKTQRARVPYESLQWLIKMLEGQGQTLDVLEQMNQGALGQMVDMLKMKQQGLPPNGMGGTPGAEMPEGPSNGTSISSSGNSPISGINPEPAPNYGGANRIG